MEPTAGNDKKRAGFTLVELLVTLAVAVILATVAVPNFRGLLERNQFAIEYNEVLSGFYYARSEAIKRRENVTATISQADGTWRLVVTDSASPANELMVREGEDGDVSVPSGSVSFNSLGRRDSCSGWEEGCTVTVSSASLTGVIEINVTGRVAK
ncbi:GspH/FimT family pseudopilin [Halomonas sp. M4R5S39]|uniref:GspH/FimT family pseudopilin n=1 Tax=Halomonas kalidii TaxID=3043293 RepID=UPI0024A9F161|nr:GspH/FimT family pseudopilin [Halomonas kalidii]MDI5983510.1 GspH/FimT family pseudopilin [Halomonas kalidii]